MAAWQWSLSVGIFILQLCEYFSEYAVNKDYIVNVSNSLFLYVFLETTFFYVPKIRIKYIIIVSHLINGHCI